jgi:hypothetical protein
LSPAERPPEPLAPPLADGPDGSPRGVGVELEVGGIGARDAADLVVRLRGGRVVERDPYRYLVVGGALGDVTVELDLRAAHPPAGGSLLGARRLAARVVGLAAGLLAPTELVFAPLPPTRLPEIDRLVGELLGLQPGLRPAGPHLNPEVASFDPAYLAGHLRAFCALAPGLRRAMGLPPARHFGFTTAYPATYAGLLADPGYRPDLATLVEDYLAANPTRYRELDMLPLFTLLSPDTVRGRLRLQKVKPRPVFHWRMPGARPYGGVVADWNRWVEVERLAADRERLTAATQTAGEA